MNNLETPQIWVGCLAAYNNGRLHGKWIDASKDVDEMWEGINEVLKSSPEPNAEEWEIFDTSNLPVDGCLDTIAQAMMLIDDHGQLAIEVIKQRASDIEDAQRMLEEQYLGEHDSEMDYVHQYFDDCLSHDVPEHISFYIDFEKLHRNMFHFGELFSVYLDGSYHIFDSSM